MLVTPRLSTCHVRWHQAVIHFPPPGLGELGAATMSFMPKFLPGLMFEILRVVGIEQQGCGYNTSGRDTLVLIQLSFYHAMRSQQYILSRRRRIGHSSPKMDDSVIKPISFLPTLDLRELS